MRALLLTTTALMMAGSASAAANLIVNGDFEAGNTGFTSDYTYVMPAGQMSLYPEATYTVDTNANNVHNLWASYGDHTTGSGKYLIVNGASSPATVWQSSAVVLGTGTYAFTAYVASSYPTSPAVLSFTATSGAGPSAATTIATYDAPSTTGVWGNVSGIYTVTKGGADVSFAITNANIAQNGNDFGIDDISLVRVGGVPEAATWAMMIAGFAMVGVATRRRALHAA